MRHLKRTAKLGRTGTHRNAMLANMVCSLIKHKRITTTLAKAKAARSVAEKIVSLGKQGTVHARRLATAQPGELLAVPASRLCGNVRRPALDHDRCMVADRTSPALMRFSSLPVRDAADVLSMLPSVGRPCSGRGARNAAWVSLAAWAPTAIRMPSRSR